MSETCKAREANARAWFAVLHPDRGADACEEDPEVGALIEAHARDTAAQARIGLDYSDVRAIVDGMHPRGRYADS